MNNSFFKYFADEPAIQTKPMAPPPGIQDNVMLILSWVSWVVMIASVIGILVCAIRMAVMHRRGETGEHASNLAFVLGACILSTAATAIVQALIH